MKFIACSVLLLVILGESYGKPTSPVNRDTSNVTTNSRSNGTVEGSQGDKEHNKELFNTSAGGETTTTSHTVTVAETQKDIPVAIYSVPSAPHLEGTPVTAEMIKKLGRFISG